MNHEVTMDMERRIEKHELPTGAGQTMRAEFSWKLFVNGKCVARSSNYFPTPADAEIALDEFLRVAPSARIVIEPGTTDESS